jgi:hypothetical protein
MNTCIQILDELVTDLYISKISSKKAHDLAPIAPWSIIQLILKKTIFSYLKPKVILLQITVTGFY